MAKSNGKEEKVAKASVKVEAPVLVTGYEGLDPERLPKETDAQFNARVDMFESARANAGGLRSRESADRAIERLEQKFEEEKTAIEAKVQQ